MAEAYTKRFHFNDPLYIQLWYYIAGILEGDLGYSWTRGTYVSTVISQTLPNTLQLVFLALVITLILSIPLGIISCKYHDRAPDYGIRAFYLAGISSPTFSIALVLVLIFSYVFHIFPTGGLQSLSVPHSEPITRFIIVDCLIQGNWLGFIDALEHMIMPSLALALGNFGYVVRLLRSSLLEVMQTNYIRTARAKGLNERAVLMKHALRNALIPVVTLTALITSWLMSLSLFVENIFAYPGIGQYLVQAIGNLDYAAVMGITLVFTTIVVVLNLAADIIYTIVNPEIRI
jgi:peptide/nickel transport system permease protein